MSCGASDIKPPQCVRWLVQLVGDEAALTLVEKHGGARVFIPAKISAKSELVKSTGISPLILRRLVAARPGENIKLPICREWRVRVYRTRDGDSYGAIARRLNIDERSVWRILHESGMTNQLELQLDV
jgi:hypothetical protein